MSKNKLWTKNAKIIFLVGSPRSGTTWLQAMLATHPSITTGPETHFFESIDSFVRSYYFEHPRPDGLREYLTEDEFFEEIANLFHKIASKLPEPSGNPKFFLEKTPQHSMFLDVIVKCFPTAYFIHIIRDPRHVVASILRVANSWGRGYFPSSALVAAKLWKKSVLSAKEFSQSFSEVKFFEIRYEDLKNDCHYYLSEIFSFLGLDYDRQLLDFIVKKNSFHKVKSTRKFESILYPSASYEPEGFFGRATTGPKNSLTLLQRYQVELVCGDLMYQLGYVSSYPKIPLWARILCSWRLRKFLKLNPI